MKTHFALLISALICFSFRPMTDKVANNARPGFYISIEDFTDRTNHEFIVESKDSVDGIFNQFFKSELELGEINNPISIYNRKHSFYVARVNVYETPAGEKKFKHLKYSSVYVKRTKLKPAVF